MEKCVEKKMDNEVWKLGQFYGDCMRMNMDHIAIFPIIKNYVEKKWKMKWELGYMVVYTPQNTTVLTIWTPKKVPRSSGNPPHGG